MNQSAELLIWLVTHGKRLRIEQKLTTFEWDPPIYHFTFKTNLLEPVVSGHACSLNLAEAKLKACVEFLERLNLRLQYKGLLSIGFACHFEDELAKKNAYNELLERDSFLWHWHNFIAPTLVAEKKVYDLSIRTFQLQCRDPLVKVAMTQIKTDEGQSLIGLGSSESLESAFNKSFLEAQASYHNLKINNPENLNLSEFERIERVIPRHHFQLSLSDQYIKLIEDWIRSKSILSIPPLPKIVISQCVWDESLKGQNLKMYRAKSHEVMNFYFGRNPFQGLTNPYPHPMA